MVIWTLKKLGMHLVWVSPELVSVLQFFEKGETLISSPF